MTIANVVLGLALAYSVLGAVIAIAFEVRGLSRIDPKAHGAHPIFRILILPGLIALWPLVWRCWRRAATEEKSA